MFHGRQHNTEAELLCPLVFQMQRGVEKLAHPPPTPPARLASCEMKMMIILVLSSSSNLRFLMIALAYAVPTGVIAGWAGVLDMILTPANVSQVRTRTRTRNVWVGRIDAPFGEMMSAPFRRSAVVEHSHGKSRHIFETL